MKIILAYKNFAANKSISHIGLGVAALNTCKVLRANGMPCEVWPIIDPSDLRKKINLAHDKPTHVVISAPWIATESLASLCMLFPDTEFLVNCHSNVGFLQADSNGVKLLREGLDLEMALPNFKIAANSKKMVRWIEDAYGNPVVYAPNLYYLDPRHAYHHKPWKHGHLKIGVFGATRPQKNIMSAVGAAIEISHQLKAQTEIWMSTGRLEGGGLTILRAVQELTRDLPLVTLKESGWKTWPQFRRLVSSMHLLLQPSYTESFNMVTADGIAEGVPTVVSEAIDWTPGSWEADVDDVFDIAKVGRYLLFDPLAAAEGLEHLKHFIVHGVLAWKKLVNH